MVDVTRALVVGLAILFGSCASPPTQVVVRLATDLDVPSQLDAITLEIVRVSDGRVLRTQDVLELGAVVGADGFREIASFGLVPEGGDPSRRFEVRARARRGGAELFTTRARSGFLTERTIRLDLYIPRICVDVAATCEPDETCGLGGCVDPNVDPSTLPALSEAPPTDPMDPRPPATPSGSALIRALRPLTGERVSSASVTLEVTMAPEVEAVMIERCDDPACTSSSTTAGTSLSASLDPSRRVHYWRAVGHLPDGTRVLSPTYWFQSRAVDRGFDGSCGQVFDWDGDAVPDVAAGAPGTGGTGAVYIYQGGPGPVSEWSVQAIEAPPVAARFGASVSAGDVDGDGLIELLVGAPASGTSGRVYVYDRRDVSAPSGTIEQGSGGGLAQFGMTVASAGDLDGDGFSDVAIAGRNSADQVVIELWRGAAEGLVYARVMSPLDTGEVALAGGGDVDGDGADDLLIGAPGRAPGGWAHILRGASEVDGWGLAAATPTGGPADGSRYGAAVSWGDAVGDGRCDAFVGAPLAGGGVGAVYHSSEGSAFTQIPLSTTPNDQLGLRLALADLDDDGRDDLVSYRQPLRGMMFLYVASGAELPTPTGFTSITWLFPDGGGGADVRLVTIGDTGGALGEELVAADVGAGLSVITSDSQLGDLAVPSGAMELGASVR